MSKKYKLIKKYPGIYYNVGTIVIKKPNGWYELENSTSCANTPDNVENYPEFWEEIKEYSFEILQFRNKITGTIFNRCIDIPIFISNYENCEIYSIKRKFDREIFTIGDYCSPKNYKNPGRIEKFEFVLEDQLRIQGKNERGRSWYLSLETVEKLKDPLFITEDNVGVFINNTVYEVRKNTLEIVNFKLNKIPQTDRYLFSSKEAAEKYIEENKPLYSRKQVINILKGFDRDINCFDERFDYNFYIERYKDEK